MMPKILVSIKDTHEANIIKDLKIDIVDLKEISEPPMGCLLYTSPSPRDS